MLLEKFLIFIYVRAQEIGVCEFNWHAHTGGKLWFFFPVHDPIT